ncbi:hypothetical protein PVAND_007990 [Polypedilum vanderplanki]|uniref:RING-type domain-containing protein n=1 Tax=Polypedilum vanderplanki TaxID=319348 RepID=A0A9J6C8J5_POLVA|nr:hypothetical protein PVAND_007990 [Polypedilum vanderplanki]
MINPVLLTSSISSMFPLVAFISVVAVIIILLVKVTFNLEVIRQSSMTINATVEIPRITMTKVLIPFSLSLQNRESDGTVKFTVSSNTKYTLQAFFNVSIREMHLSLSLRSWEEIKESVNVRNGYIIEQAFCKQLALDLRNQNPHEERTISIKTPEEMNLGRAPRLAYPLVIFLIRADTEGNENADETVLLMNVIHLQDSFCPLPTSILAQYLKQASGQLSCLKQLYLSSIDSDGEYSYSKTNMGSLSLAEPCTSDSMPILCSDTVMQENNNDQLCVVCRYYPLSRALLPCRHTVLCAICFSKLDRCPICRSTITSYFCIRSEDYIGSANTVMQEPKKSLNWIDAVNDFINDRLTDFLGFR